MAPSRSGRRLFAAFVAAILAGAFSCSTPADATTIQVYKTPTCGCCSKWIDHLRDAGFAVEATDLPDLSRLKAENGVARGLSSCHTALIEGYVLEGHVPASDIERLLAERPTITGLAVPGMPMGSPGMEHPIRAGSLRRARLRSGRHASSLPIRRSRRSGPVRARSAPGARRRPIRIEFRYLQLRSGVVRLWPTEIHPAGGVAAWDAPPRRPTPVDRNPRRVQLGPVIVQTLKNTSSALSRSSATRTAPSS